MCLIHFWHKTTEICLFQIPAHDVSLGIHNIHEPERIDELVFPIRTCTSCNKRQILSHLKTWINWPYKKGDVVKLEPIVHELF